MSFHQVHNDYSTRHFAESGMVVVVALFIVAIIAALSYAMIASLSQDTHRTEMILNDIELANQAEGSILWAKDLLITNFQRKAQDKRVDIMPFTSPVNDTGRFRIVSRIYDMQSKYNINRLGEMGGNDKEISAAFIRLLKSTQIKLTDEQLNKLVDAIIDWMRDTQGNAALNTYYEGLAFPYLAAHQKMAHASELLLVKGMTRDIYDKLQPYVVALPENPSINILTATPPVLTTLSSLLTLDKAIVLHRAMNNARVGDKSQLTNNQFINQYKIKDNYVVVSDYFLVETRAALESQQLIIYTLMWRMQGGDKKVDIRIIWQSKGIA